MHETASRWNTLVGDIRGRGLWVVLGCLLCQTGLGFNYVFGPLAGDMIDEFGWTRATFSGARAPQLFIIAAASPLVGAMAIRFGAQRILIAGTILLATAFLLFSRMQSLAEMYGLVILLGLSVTALGDISVGQLVTQWVDRGRGLALGIVYTGSNLGGWLLVPLVTGIAARESWRAAFATLGVLALVAILPVAIWVTREPKRERRTAPDAPPSDRHFLGGSDRDLDLSAALRTRSFWILAATLASFFFYFLGMLDCFVLFLTDIGIPRTLAARYLGTSIGLGIASKIVLGLIADRVRYKTAMLGVFSLLALSSVVLLALPEPRLIWAFVGLFGFATAARDVVSPLIVTRCFGPRYLAQIYGALMLALLPGGVLGPIFAASVHDRSGSYDAAFATFAAMNLGAVFALCFLRREITDG